MIKWILFGGGCDKETMKSGHQRELEHKEKNGAEATVHFLPIPLKNLTNFLIKWTEHVVMKLQNKNKL